MKILVTGAKGFVGKNLCSQLRNIRDGKARWYGFRPAAEADGAPKEQVIEAIFEYDIDSTLERHYAPRLHPQHHQLK